MRVMKIEIINVQKCCGINRMAVIALVLFFMKKACGNGGFARWKDITLQITDNKGIRRINEAVFSSGDVTDVISSTYTPIPGEQARLTGEVAVNAQRAVELTTKERHAAASGWSGSEELALYIAHGCDHLSGEDDNNRARRERMRRRELRWLKEARHRGMLTDVITISKSPGKRTRKA
jgi:rRNA maturation RNase YbeY